MAEITVPTSITPNAELARDAFLVRQPNENTRRMYAVDLRMLFQWCERQSLDPFELRRPHLELFVDHLTTERHNAPASIRRRMGVISQFYKLAQADELTTRNPTVMLKLARVRQAPETIAWLEPYEVSKLLRYAEAETPAHHVLIALMSMLALRVSEACAIQIEDITEDDNGYRSVLIHSKGGYLDTMPVPVPLWRIMKTAAGERLNGPLILRRGGRAQDRNGAYAWVKILAAKADLRGDLHPHSMRHSSITALVDAGADLLTAMRFARHRDPKFTEHYYRRRDNFDAHGAHITTRLFSR